MDRHLKDYNFLVTLMPEINIWNQILSLVDISTLNNFLVGFPVMKLFYNFTSSPRYIGTLTVTTKMKFYYTVGEDTNSLVTEKSLIPIYEYLTTKEPIRWLINSFHLFIMDDMVYLVFENGKITELTSITVCSGSGRYRETEIDKFLFIGEILKYRIMTDTFLEELQEKI